MCVRGRDWARSPFPSLVTIVTDPVSAIRKLAPVMPTSARRKTSRSAPRASSVIWRASSSERSTGRSPCAPRKVSANWSLVRWIAGITIWLGVSSRSWRTYSPRSVSTVSNPASMSAVFRSISSVTIDLPLATVLAPASRQIRATASRASAASRHQCTAPPLAKTFASNRSRFSARLASAPLRMSRAASRRDSNSGSLATVSTRPARASRCSRSSAPSSVASRRAAATLSGKRALSACILSRPRRRAVRRRGGRRPPSPGARAFPRCGAGSRDRRRPPHPRRWPRSSRSSCRPSPRRSPGT